MRDERPSNDHRLEIEEILEVEGSPTVVVHLRMSGRSQSGIPVDARWVHVFEFRGSQIIRARNFSSRDSAVQAPVELACTPFRY